MNSLQQAPEQRSTWKSKRGDKVITLTLCTETMVTWFDSEHRAGRSTHSVFLNLYEFQSARDTEEVELRVDLTGLIGQYYAK